MNIPDDVIELVLAARVVALDQDFSLAAIQRLDEACEAFAERIAWDEED